MPTSRIARETSVSSGNGSIVTVQVDMQTRLRELNVKSILFCVLALPMLGTIYSHVNSQGIRGLLPIFGTRLHKMPVPGFSFMQHYQNLRDLDLAHVFAIFMLFGVWVLGIALMEMFLFGVRADARLNMKFHIRFLYCISSIVIITDLFMFYRGCVHQGGWEDSTGGLTALIATVGYTGLLAFVAYVHVMLKRRIF